MSHLDGPQSGHPLPVPPPPRRAFRGRPPDEPGRRLFIAVPIPGDVALRVEALVDELRPGDPGAPGEVLRRPGDVRWVRLDQLHVTLRFLGPTLDERIPAAIAAMESMAANSGPFVVALHGAGAFPNLDRPRALWVGIDDPSAGLGRLAEELDRSLIAAGWPPAERPYQAHLTLARTDGVRAGPRVARRLVSSAAGLDARFAVDHVVLYESVTGGGPARYVPLAMAALRSPSETG